MVRTHGFCNDVSHGFISSRGQLSGIHVFLTAGFVHQSFANSVDYTGVVISLWVVPSVSVKPFQGGSPDLDRTDRPCSASPGTGSADVPLLSPDVATTATVGDTSVEGLIFPLVDAVFSPSGEEEACCSLWGGDEGSFPSSAVVAVAAMDVGSMAFSS